MSQTNTLTFVAIRHGESELDKARRKLGENCLTYNIEASSDQAVTLSNYGRIQSKELATRLRQTLSPTAQIQAIITSPFLRTRETATILVNALGISEQNLFIDAALSKRNLGQLWNTSWLGLQDLYPQEYLRYLAYKEAGLEYAYAPPNGESYLELFARSDQFCEEKLSAYSKLFDKAQSFNSAQKESFTQKVLIAVTHSSNLAAFVRYFEGLSAQEAIDAYNNCNFKNTDLLIYSLNRDN